MSVDSFLASGSSPTRPCRIGLIGFGAVGSAVARRLTGPPAWGSPPLHLTHIVDRRADEKRGALAGRDPAVVWTTRVDDLLGSDVDIVVEAVGGVEDAVEWMRAALLAGKSVVTSNKQAIAHHGPALQRLAARQGRQLRFEAAVGGAMPIVRAVGEGLAGDCITRLSAILNGTTNAVLSCMEATGCPMEQALTEARARGYAESDPSVDLDGLDAAAKLAILCGLAFRIRVEPARIDTRSAAAIGPRDFDEARRRGGTIRQIAHAAYEPSASALTAWVAPVIVRRGSLFARATGPRNAAVITGAFAGDISLSGAGAGGDATAVSIVGDLLAIARDRAAIVPAPALSSPATIAGWPAAPADCEWVGATGTSGVGGFVTRARAAGVRVRESEDRKVGRRHQSAEAV